MSNKYIYYDVVLCLHRCSPSQGICTDSYTFLFLYFCLLIPHLLPFLLIADFISRQGFGRGSNKNNSNNSSNSNVSQRANTSPAQSPISQTQTQTTVTSVSTAEPLQNEHQRDIIKYFFQEKYAPLNVKGNFLTLCACPKNVELGEWLAHQGSVTVATLIFSL